MRLDEARFDVSPISHTCRHNKMTCRSTEARAAWRCSGERTAGGPGEEGRRSYERGGDVARDHAVRPEEDAARADRVPGLLVQAGAGREQLADVLHAELVLLHV